MTEEEDLEFVQNTTGDSALQEDFLPFGNNISNTLTMKMRKGSVGDVQGASSRAFQFINLVWWW